MKYIHTNWHLKLYKNQMSQFRIQKRMYAPNILEVEISGLNPKDKNYKGGKWKPYLAPLVGKKEGDALVDALLNILKIAKKI